MMKRFERRARVYIFRDLRDVEPAALVMMAALVVVVVTVQLLIA